MRVLIRHQLTVILALGLLVSVQSIAQETQTGALQLELVRDGVAQSVRPLFKVEMHNKTARPLILCLGWNVGGKNYAGEIKFSLTDVSGRTRHLVKRDPAYVAGSLGSYIVTIPEGGTFELPSIDLVDYWSYEPTIAVLALPAGRYSLTAEYTGHNPDDDVTPAPGQPPFISTPKTSGLEALIPTSWRSRLPYQSAIKTHTKKVVVRVGEPVSVETPRKWAPLFGKFTPPIFILQEFRKFNRLASVHVAC